MIKMDCIGKISDEIKIKEVTGGKKVANITLCCKSGNSLIWQDCVLWEGVAETFQKNTGKGFTVWVSGDLKETTWVTKGIQNKKTELKVEKFEFLARPKNEQITLEENL